MRKQELHPRTAVINKTQKNHSKKARIDALVWLAEQFPSAFDNTQRIRPLKTGIMDDILQHAEKAQEAGISRSKLREAVVLFTRRLDYLTCLKAREMRVDLEGNEVAEVTEEEAENAGGKIKKRVEKSVRNARKMMTAEKTPAKTNPLSYTTKSTSSSSQSLDEYLPTYPPRAPSASMQNEVSPSPKISAVVVKHKTTRQFDPDAVARLKEKLGLSRSAEEKKETIE